MKKIDKKKIEEITFVDSILSDNLTENKKTKLTKDKSQSINHDKNFFFSIKDNIDKSTNLDQNTNSGNSRINVKQNIVLTKNIDLQNKQSSKKNFQTELYTNYKEKYFLKHPEEKALYETSLNKFARDSYSKKTSNVLNIENNFSNKEFFSPISQIKDNNGKESSKKWHKSSKNYSKEKSQPFKISRELYKTKDQIQQKENILFTNKEYWKKDFFSKKEKKAFFANLAKRKMYRIVRTKSYFRKTLNKYNRKVSKNNNKRTSRFSFLVSLRIGPHNIFSNLSGLRGKKKTYLSSTAGKYKIQISKKKIKHVYSILLNKFYTQLRKIVRNKGLIFNIISPIKIRKKIVKTILHGFKRNWCIVNAIPKKCFNGCRPPKKIRKKRQPRLRLFK